MDLSDGLGDAAHQMAEACGTGVRIDAARLPIDPAARRWMTQNGADAVEASIAAGDDYELLFAVPGKAGRRLAAVGRLARGLPLTRIGELTKARDVILLRDGKADALPFGFSHF